MLPAPVPSPRLQKRADRRDQILAAARSCFARTGFHATSVQAICAEAGMSPGNLYRYFPSKEALVEALCAEDMNRLTGLFDELIGTDNFFGAMQQIIERELLHRPIQDMVLWIETLAESSRNPDVACIVRQPRNIVQDNILRALETAKARGNIPPGTDIPALTTFLMTYTDGLALSRLRNPAADHSTAMRMLLTSVSLLLAASTVPNDNLPGATP